MGWWYKTHNNSLDLKKKGILISGCLFLLYSCWFGYFANAYLMFEIANPCSSGL